MDSMLILNMVDLGFDPGLVNSKTLNYKKRRYLI